MPGLLYFPTNSGGYLLQVNGRQVWSCRMLVWMLSGFMIIATAAQVLITLRYPSWTFLNFQRVADLVVCCVCQGFVVILNGSTYSHTGQLQESLLPEHFQRCTSLSCAVCLWWRVQAYKHAWDGWWPRGTQVWSAVIVFQGAKISPYMVKKRTMGGLTNGSKGIYES
jgi:hypothetical protein